MNDSLVYHARSTIIQLVERFYDPDQGAVRHTQPYIVLPMLF